MTDIDDTFEGVNRPRKQEEQALNTIHGRLANAMQQRAADVSYNGKSEKKVLKGLEIKRSEVNSLWQLDVIFNNADNVKARKMTIVMEAQDDPASPTLYAVSQSANTKTKSVENMPNGGVAVTTKKGWQPVNFYGPSLQTGLTEQAVEGIFNKVFNKCAMHIKDARKRKIVISTLAVGMAGSGLTALRSCTADNSASDALDIPMSEVGVISPETVETLDLTIPVAPAEPDNE